ncbi:MAG: hypothetical protein WC765_00435 [Phycisphaerae bacterium]|jgi:5-methyltetrahydrofolate--homocysteine methyltransferase
MGIEFSEQRWQKVKSDTKAWWEGMLGRPLIQIRLKGKKTECKEPSTPLYPFTSFYDDTVSADQIIDCWDHQLCQTRFMGDAFPVVFPNFGPGVIAAFLGAILTNGNNTVWLHPAKDIEIGSLCLECQPNNPWLCRIIDVIRVASKRWRGMVQIAMTDLGGSLDILSTFRPSEKLLFDLYDHPADVNRILWQASALWHRYFEQLSEAAAPYNPGYSNWALIFSEQPSYILQCDFCYMLGPDMFKEFVLPELESTAKKLSNVFYHLDGPGQLVHLDNILRVDAIKGIEWVPGAGQPDVTHWPDVYKKITDAGKKIHIFHHQADNPFEVLSILKRQIGRLDNVLYVFDGDISQEEKINRFLKIYMQ